uniref:Rubisco LSMT substrate-binding domain-containing protein n=1 Tax=Fibrocapsa japonica TaxID=94617 RepID=A0A7S2XYG6_9STRA
MEQLQGSPIVSATVSMQKKLEAEFNTMKNEVLPRLAKSGYPKPVDEVFTFEEFKWAFCMLFSRAICLNNLMTGPAVALIPYADLFNHNPYSNTFIETDVIGGWFEEKKDEIRVYCDRSYKRMEQVCISYGQKSNLELLLLYGFCLDRNPFNSVDLSVSLPADEPMFEEKRDFLDGKGVKPDMNFPVYADRYPDELLQFLRLVCLTAEDRIGPEGTPLDLWELRFSQQINDSNEMAVLNLIAEACELALSRYPTTEEQDVDLIKDYKMFALLPRNTRLAVKARRQEKRILKRTIAAVEREKEKIILATA